MYLLAALPVCGVLSWAPEASSKDVTKMLLTSCSRWRGEGTWGDGSGFIEPVELDVEDGRGGDCWNSELMSEPV